MKRPSPLTTRPFVSGRHHPAAKQPDAFTLIELLVVISVVGVLSAILLPIFATMRKTTDRVTCLSHLQQMIVASNLAAGDNNNSYPRMHGYNWEEGDVWIADALAPYVGSIVNKDPTKLLRCPAAEKNAQESWLSDSKLSHYRFNYYHNYHNYLVDKEALVPKVAPLYGYSNAVLFIDTTYPDWQPNWFSHFPGSAPTLNVGYADGHVATLSYSEYKKLDNNPDESLGDLFNLGWTKGQATNP